MCKKLFPLRYYIVYVLRDSLVQTLKLLQEQNNLCKEVKVTKSFVKSKITGIFLGEKKEMKYFCEK